MRGPYHRGRSRSWHWLSTLPSLEPTSERCFWSSKSRHWAVKTRPWWVRTSYLSHCVVPESRQNFEGHRARPIGQRSKVARDRNAPQLAVVAALVERQAGQGKPDWEAKRVALTLWWNRQDTSWHTRGSLKKNGIPPLPTSAFPPTSQLTHWLGEICFWGNRLFAHPYNPHH